MGGRRDQHERISCDHEGIMKNEGRRADGSENLRRHRSEKLLRFCGMCRKGTGSLKYKSGGRGPDKDG